MTMNPEIKAQWVNDLRSGEYEQGAGALNRNGKLCCLGVLCEQAAKAGVVIRTVRGAEVFYDDYEEGSILPGKVREWAGLPCEGRFPNNPHVTMPDGSGVALAELNDGILCEPHTFVQIADIIDAQL